MDNLTSALGITVSPQYHPSPPFGPISGQINVISGHNQAAGGPAADSSGQGWRLAGQISRGRSQWSSQAMESNVKLNDVKKKIALVEGKRRALHNTYEREKKENRIRTRLLQEDLEVSVRKAVEHGAIRKT